MSHFYTEPSEQTVQAIDNCRGDFAKTRGVTRNAIDQLFAANTHDPYPPFRDFYKDVCATPEANPDAYLNDLLSIRQRFRPASTKSVIESFTCNLGKAHDLIETCADALKDGTIDKNECRKILNGIGDLEDELRGLKESVMKQHNILNGSILPDDVKEKAKVRAIR
jgi:hypothetical protein